MEYISEPTLNTSTISYKYKNQSLISRNICWMEPSKHKMLKFDIWQQHRITGSFTCEGTLRCPQSKLVYKQDQLCDQTRFLRDFLKNHEKLWNEGRLTFLGKSVPLPVFLHCVRTHFRSRPLSFLVPLGPVHAPLWKAQFCSSVAEKTLSCS